MDTMSAHDNGDDMASYYADEWPDENYFSGDDHADPLDDYLVPSDAVERKPEPRFPGWPRLDDENWTTREGVRMRIGDMTPRHAFNAWRMFMRGSRLWNYEFKRSLRDFSMLGDVTDSIEDVLNREVDERGERPCSFTYDQPFMRALWSRACDAYPAPADGERDERNVVLERVAERYGAPYESTTLAAMIVMDSPVAGRAVAYGPAADMRELSAVWIQVGRVVRILPATYVAPNGAYVRDDWERREDDRMMSWEPRYNIWTW